MNDQNTTTAVDDTVAQANSVQDLFKANDATQAPLDPVVLDSPPAPMPVQPLFPVQQPSQKPAGDQKSPLDILEEILSKEEKKNDEAPQEAGPTPEELQLIEQQKQQEQAMIEEARQKMMTETQTDEQKKRDSIRQEQIDANKVNNPFAIRQIEHKKIIR